MTEENQTPFWLEQQTDTIGNLSASSLEKIREREDVEPETGLSTGFLSLDEKIGGFRSGNLYFLSGRPSQGKTAFVESILAHIAVEEGVPAVLFSQEYTRAQVGRAFLSLESGILVHHINRGTITEEQMESLEEAAASLAEAPLLVCDSRPLAVSQLEERVQVLKKREGVQLVVVDPIEDMRNWGRGEDSRTHILHELKSLTEDEKLPLLVTHTLRDRVQREDVAPPELHDLHSQGIVENRMDVVMFLHRPYHYTGDDDRPPRLNIARHRGGPVGDVELRYDRDLMKFYEPETQPLSIDG